MLKTRSPSVSSVVVIDVSQIDVGVVTSTLVVNPTPVNVSTALTVTEKKYVIKLMIMNKLSYSFRKCKSPNSFIQMETINFTRQTFVKWGV